MLMKRLIASVASAVILSSAPGVWAQEPTPGGTLEFAVLAGPPTYDLHSANSFAVIHYVAPHYSTLLTFDWENYPEIEGDLAESWEVSDDLMTYTFKLHRGVTFHDGSPLTSADVVASYERLRNPPEGVVSVRQGQFSDIASIEAPDDHTVIFRMSRPNTAMMMVFSSPWNVIYSAAKLAEDPRFPATNVLGTGPFKFVEHVAGSRWVGEKYDGYFVKDRPYLDGFTAVQLAGPALVNALQGGQVMTEFRGIAPPQRDQLASAMGDDIKFLEGGRMTNWLFAINTTRPPFDDVRVRQALNLAIDRCEGMKQLSKITLVLPEMGGPVWPENPAELTAEEYAQHPGYNCDIEANRARARELLREAGQEGMSFTLTNRAIPHPYDVLGIFVVDQWQRIGLDVKMESLPTSRYAPLRTSGDFDVIVDFAPEYTDSPALNFNKYISHSKSPENYARYEDEKLDALFERIKYETDTDKRNAAIKEFQGRLLDQAYWVFMSYSTRIVPMDPKVKGWVFAPSHTLNQSLRDVWIAQ